MLGGTGRGAVPFTLFHWVGVRKARRALHTKFFPSLLYSEGAFSGVLDSSVQEKSSGSKPQTPNQTYHNYEINILNILFLENSLKIKIFPCGGAYI